MDEEHAFGLGIMIKENFLKNGKRLFDIADSSTVFYFHGLPKQSLLESKKYKLAGQIEFLKWDSAKVVLKENIKVLDSASNVIRKYHGKRRFTRDYGDLKLYFN